MGSRLGLRVGVEVGVECWAWGEAVTVGVHVHGGGCDRGYACCGKLLREYVEQVLALLLRRAGEVGGEIKRTRASAGAAPCAAWFGARCVGGRCGGYGREGYRGLHLGLGKELALLHGVDPEDEVILTCTTCDRARAQQRPTSLPRARGRRRTWKVVALVCFWWQGLALPELVQAGHERRKPLLRPEIELRVDGHLVQ